MDVLDKDKAQTDPGHYFFYKSADVVSSTELSSREKARALQEWELEARLFEVTTEERMNKKKVPSVLPEV